MFTFLWKKIQFCWKNLHLIFGTTQYCDTQHTIHNTQHKIHSWFIISFETLLGLVKAVFGEVVCLSWICLGTGGSWTVCWQRQMMFVDSDRRWLLTVTDNQFVDRCTIYWQLTLWLPSRSHQILIPLRPYTLPHRSPPSCQQPSRFRDRRSCPRSRPRSHHRLVPARFCRHRFSSRLHHLFSVFL